MPKALTLPLAIAIDDPDLAELVRRPARAVLLQLHDLDFSSRAAKERLTNSFAFNSFVRKQTLVRESKKKKKRKKRRLIFARVGGGGGVVRIFRTMLCTPLSVEIKLVAKQKWLTIESEYLLSGSSGTSKNRVTGYSMYSFQP